MNSCDELKSQIADEFDDWKMIEKRWRKQVRQRHKKVQEKLKSAISGLTSTQEEQKIQETSGSLFINNKNLWS